MNTSNTKHRCTRRARRASTQFWAVTGMTASVALLCASHSDASEWTTVNLHKAGLSLEAPAVPEERVSSHESFVGAIATHHFTTRERDVVFTAEVSVLPPIVTTLVGNDTVLREATQAFLDDTAAHCVSHSDIQYAGATGTQLDYALPSVDGRPARTGRANFFLLGRSLYIFYAEAPEAEGWASAERFLSSVRFE